MKTKNKNKGFTLIELLVVISIIGLMSSVVLASLSTARTKAADSAIKANMRTIQNAAALYYDTAQTYGVHVYSYEANFAPCNLTLANLFSDPKIVEAINASKNLLPAASGVRCTVSADGQAYAIAIPLKSGGLWCVSSKGVAMAADANGDAVTPAFCDDGN